MAIIVWCNLSGTYLWAVYITVILMSDFSEAPWYCQAKRFVLLWPFLPHGTCEIWVATGHVTFQVAQYFLLEIVTRLFPWLPSPLSRHFATIGFLQNRCPFWGKCCPVVALSFMAWRFFDLSGQSHPLRSQFWILLYLRSTEGASQHFYVCTDMYQMALVSISSSSSW